MTNDYFIGLLTKDQMIDLVKKMMSLNECTGHAIYQLSKLNINNSGYTFGICQHDCGQRAEARDFIKKCLSMANVSDDQLKSIMLVLADHTKKLLSEQLELVNNILLLPVNMEAINQFDADYISAAVDYVKSVVTQHLGTPLLGENQHLEKSNLVVSDIARTNNLSEMPHLESFDLNETHDIGMRSRNQIVNRTALFLQLVDYHNQFHLSATGLLIEFLNGQAINRSSVGTGRTAKIDATKIDTDLLSEIRRFINEYTEYGIEHRHDCIRRQHNIDILMIQNFTHSTVF